MRRRGFTLLEMLVATALMGIAVVALLSNLSTSLRNTARLAGHDRAVLLARQKLEELLLDRNLRFGTIQGSFDPTETGGVATQWQATASRFEAPPKPGPGTAVLQRIELQVSWTDGGSRHELKVAGYRALVLRPDEVEAR